MKWKVKPFKKKFNKTSLRIRKDYFDSLICEMFLQFYFSKELFLEWKCNKAPYFFLLVLDSATLHS
jgi:hypothetical protein